MSSDRPLSDRRTYLKYAGVAAVTALAGCGGDGGDGGDGDDGDDGGDDGPGHEVPHPDDATVPDSEVNAQSLGGQSRPDEPDQAKDSVGYAHEPSGDQYCGNCSLYVPDQNDDGFGACVVVQGKIHPCDYCNLWAEYDGDDAVPCES
ncbi:MAG: hypothetical protein ACQEQY_05960 [Halobacteriota archaeon]